MNWPYKKTPTVSAEERIKAAAIEARLAPLEDQTTAEVPELSPATAQRPVEVRSIADQVTEAIALALSGGEGRPAGLIQGMPLTQVGLHQHAELEIEKKTGLGHVVDRATFRQDH